MMVILQKKFHRLALIPNTAALCYVVSNATIVSFGIF